MKNKQTNNKKQNEMQGGRDGKRKTHKKQRISKVMKIHTKREGERAREKTKLERRR